MLTALQIKLLAAILAVLTVITGLLVRGGRPAVAPTNNASANEPAYVLTDQDRQLQKKLGQKVQPSEKKYLVP